MHKGRRLAEEGFLPDGDFGGIRQFAYGVFGLDFGNFAFGRIGVKVPQVLAGFGVDERLRR